ncbi:MAG TPA: LysR family transcriptional regulator [Gemmatimonadaceae bacterium]|jgi:DNA-binding transcriptional LysR family regulator|nr:LysR family transcriptional regulator [Gemmatimonadaceae bacterium]
MVRDTRFLRTFYAVCTHGGFGRAAARLDCTQPAVSYQVRTLERDLGAALFERGRRRVVLTPEGRRLLEFCREFFASYDRLAAELAGGAPSEEPIHIASVSGFGRYVLFPALGALLRGTTVHGVPRPRVDLRFRTADEVFRLVESGEVDLGVVYLPKLSSQLAVRHLRDEEIVLIANPSLVSSRGFRQELARLEAYETLPFVTYLEGDYVFGKWFDATFGAQPARTTSVHNFDELEEVIATVALGSGASIVPLDSARAAAARREVRVIRPVKGRRCVNRVFAVTRPGSVMRPEIESILALLTGMHTTVIPA